MNKRLPSLDFIRGLAIIGMIQTHIWEFYISSPSGMGVLLMNFVVIPFGGYAAPLFTLISGMSARLAYQKILVKKPLTKDLNLYFIRRGIILFLLATIVSLITGSVTHIKNVSFLNWSIIQLVGFCLCFVPLFTSLKMAFRLFWLLIPIILSEFIYPSFSTLTPLFTGFAPLFPWSSLYWAGMLIGETYIQILHTTETSGWRNMFFAGVLLIFPLGVLLNHSYSSFTWAHVANMSITAIVIYTGMFILLVVGSGYLLDHKDLRFAWCHAIIGLGKHALTIYYLQLIGIVLSGKFFSMIIGGAQMIHWIWFLPVTVIIITAIHILINKIWPKYNYIFTIEWFFARILKA